MASETTLDTLYSFDETTGTIDPADFSIVEKVVKSDLKAALSIDGDIELATPMGRLVEWLSAHFTGVLGLNVQNANQLLVSAAAGQQLDAMAQWFQLERKSKTYSKADVTCGANENGAVIPPKGATVRNLNGDVFESTNEESVEISPNSSATIRFEAVEPGPIDVSKGALNTIDTPITGLTFCINQLAGIPGSLIESDESLRDRIMASRTVAPGFLGAIKNAVEAVMGNGSATVLENNTNAELPVSGVVMEPHSILVCVDGLENPNQQNSYAEDSDVVKVAKAIFDTKPCGTGYTRFDSGDIQYEVPVKDAFGNEYEVYFCKPEQQPIEVSVVVQNRGYTGSSLTDDVASAVYNWAIAKNFKCGESVYSSDIIRAIEDAVPGVVTVSCRVSDAGTNKGTAYVDVSAIHKATFDKEYIFVEPLMR